LTHDRDNFHFFRSDCSPTFHTPVICGLRRTAVFQTAITYPITLRIQGIRM
jgi:hypothetical protein